MRLIGLPTDSHSSFLRGAAAAPAAIRAALASEHSNLAAEVRTGIGQDIIVEDVGDLPLDEGPDDVGRIREAAADAARDGVVPMLSSAAIIWSAIPIVAGLAEVTARSTSCTSTPIPTFTTISTAIR